MNRRDFLTQLSGAALVGATPRSERGQTPGPVQLVDVTAGAGLSFRHNTGAYGGKFLPETLGLIEGVV